MATLGSISDMMPNDRQTVAFILIVGVMGLIASLFFVYTIRRRRRRRSSAESLFGSTIKVPPMTSATYGHVAVGVQPGQPQSPNTLRESYSASDLENFEFPAKEEGLSSKQGRWARADRGSNDDTEAGASRESWKLSFKIQYQLDTSQLEVTIFRAKSTPTRHSSGLDTSVFATVYMLPEQDRRQTALYPNTGSPSFDEAFLYDLSPEEFLTKQLRLSLYDIDATRTRICLGHTIVKLADLGNVASGGVAYLNKNLEHLSVALEETGPEAHLSLYYNPQTEKLKVQIFAARNLPESIAKRTYFLRTSVILGTRTAKIKETGPSDSLYGVFQCAYSFQVPPRHIDTCCLQFSAVAARSDTYPEKTVATLMIGPCMYAHGSGVEHWKHMLQNSRKTSEMWHRLTFVEDV